MRYVLKEAQNNHRCNLSVYSAPPQKKLLGLAYKIYNGNKAPGVRRSGALPMFHIGGYHWISGANFRFFRCSFLDRELGLRFVYGIYSCSGSVFLPRKIPVTEAASP